MGSVRFGPSRRVPLVGSASIGTQRSQKKRQVDIKMAFSCRLAHKSGPRLMIIHVHAVLENVPFISSNLHVLRHAM